MITKHDIKEIVDSSLEPMKQDISTLAKDMNTVKKDIKTVKKELTKLRIAEEVSAKYFDLVTTGHQIRIKTIETHVGIKTPQN